MSLKVQPPNEGVKAIVSGNETFGASAGTTAGGSHITLGWHNEHRVLVDAENTQVRFEWPDSDYFKIRVGSKPPFTQQEDATNLE